MSAKPAKKAPPKKNTGKKEAAAPEKKQPKPKPEPVRLPALVELVFSFSGLFLVLITFMVVVLGFLAGVAPAQILLRAIVTIIVVGVILLILSSTVSNGVLKAVTAEQNKQDAPQDGQTIPSSTGHEIRA